MPIFLEPRDPIDELKGVRSVLIVSCPICPPMCIAIQARKPFLEPFRHGLKTKAFEDYIASIQSALAQHGIRSEAYTTRFPVPMMCLWTARQRARLQKRAQGFEAVLVLGCDSARYTAVDALGSAGRPVVQGMRVRTITNATMSFRPPATVTLDWHPLPEQPKFADPGPSQEKS